MRIMRTLTLTDTVMLISQTKLGGELLPELSYILGLVHMIARP